MALERRRHVNQINENGFGDANNVYSLVIFLFGGHFFVGATNTATGAEVWRLDEAVGPLQGFAMSANPSSLTINRPGMGTVTITVTSIGGFNTPVQFSYSENIPSGVTVQPDRPTGAHDRRHTSYTNRGHRTIGPRRIIHSQGYRKKRVSD